MLFLAPLLALFTVPVIGHWSDICTSKWGRRRPFIFVLSLFLVLSLMLLCFGQNLVTDPERRHNGMYVVAFAVILLDYASQAAINPCESLMADMLQSMPQSETGFMIYSAMLSMGSCIGYLLSAVDWQTLSQTTFCSSEQTAILIVLVLFTITLLVTMLAAKERPAMHKSYSHFNGSVTNGNIKIEEEEMLLPHAMITRPPSMTIQTIRKFVAKSFRLTFILACFIKVSNDVLKRFGKIKKFHNSRL